MAIPQYEVEFDRQGRRYDQAQVDAMIAQVPAWSDVIVISHGWNNDKADATKLYNAFFDRVDRLLDGGFVPGLAGRTFGAVRVLWPSKRFTDEELIPGGGAASLDGAHANDRSLHALLERLKDNPNRLGEPGPDPAREAAVSEAQALVPRLAADAQARQQFVVLLRSILDRNQAHVDDGSAEFFARPPEELFTAMEEPVNAPATTAGVGGAAAVGAEGGAAGLRDLLGGAVAAARRLVNFTTYYEMKERAGMVGRTGLCSLLGDMRRANENVRLHLVGHSFGGRLVTAAASGLEPDTPHVSLSLLQAAFSHNGLARQFDERHDGYFRTVVSDRRVSGPIVITHTRNDRAVGIAYPLASRMADQRAAALGDENDPYGGMGRNGAQHTPEATPGELLKVKGEYHFTPGAIYNLRADRYIAEHNAVTGFEVAYAVLTAAAAV